MNFYKSIALGAMLLAFGAAHAQQVVQDAPFSDMPPIPTEYGKCYAKCRIPDQYEYYDTQVLVQDGRTKSHVVPAEYDYKEETVMIKEASTKLIPVPAVYETVTEQVMIKEPGTKTITTPAKYETRSERVLVSEGQGRWVKKKKDTSCFSQNPEDCYVTCWEEVPAKYRTETKRVLVTPEESKTIELPGEYTTLTRKVLRTPATTKEVEIPAEYKTIRKKVLVRPAETRTEETPAVYKTLKEKRLVKGGGYTDWVEILCGNKTTSSVVQRLQQALKSNGYDPGAIDGVMGGQTRAAMKKYQEDKGLPVGNMNMETLRSLGVNE